MSTAGPSSIPSAPATEYNADLSKGYVYHLLSASREADDGGEGTIASHPTPDQLTSSSDFATRLQEYIFNTGFCAQQFADVQVVFFNTSLKLHRCELVLLGPKLTGSDPCTLAIPRAPDHEPHAWQHAAAGIQRCEHN